MRVKLNRVLSVLLIVVLFTTMGISAADNNETVDVNVAIIEEKINDFVPFLNMNVQNFDQNDNTLFIGEMLNVYRTENEKLVCSDYSSYPIFQKQRVIAIANIAQNDMGETIVSCTTGFAEDLNLFINSGDIAIIHNGNELYFKERDGDISQIEGESKTLDVAAEDLQYGQLEQAKEVPISTISTYALEQKTINIPRVSNYTCTEHDEGQCANACIAAIINYYKGNSFTAQDMHRIYGCFGGDYHAETKQRLNDYAIRTAGQYTSNLTYNTAKSYIDSEAVMVLDLQYSAATPVAHDVVGYGYYYNGGAKQLYYMDPNYGFGITSFPSSGSLIINTSGYNFVTHCYIKAF